MEANIGYVPDDAGDVDSSQGEKEEEEESKIFLRSSAAEPENIERFYQSGFSYRVS